ncbi:MAG: NADH-quinone oxidoreductase subunit NuoE [Actinobacteria bacterium]|nr:NADH-quinone oxidoreductase subunit NuoE [Actinomycetota bacterium]
MGKGCSCGAEFSDINDSGPLEEIIEKYKTDKGALIPILQESQEAYGYLDEIIMREIAKRGGYQLSRVYGVATFYTQFRLQPIGEYLIRVCHGTACHVAGATQITDEICNQLNVEEGDTTEDGKFTLESVMCVGACSLSPIMIVGEDTYGKLKPTDVRKVLKAYTKADSKEDDQE